MASMELEAHELEADGIVELFSIFITALPQSRAESNAIASWHGTHARVNIKNNDTVTWAGVTFEGTALKFEGAGQTEGDEKKRPTITMANPAAAFSPLVRDGVLDGAFISRFRIRRNDLENDPNTNDYQVETYRVNRVTSLNKNKLTLELRDQLDQQFFKVPARTFRPPEFQQVSLR